MKKILMLLLAAVLLVPAVQAVADNNEHKESKELQKARKNQYKNKIKELKKGKWELFGSSNTLEVALLKHYDRLERLGENGREISGTASRFKSKNVGHQQALNNAAIRYAQQAGSHVRGRMVSDVAANSENTSAEMDHFYGAYESLVEKEIKGELVESYTLIRPLDKKKTEFEMITFFIVDEDAATRARVRAMENALKESRAAPEHANAVSQFVREGFATTTD